MSIRPAAWSSALLLALVAGATAAQTIEISSPSIGRVTVRPEPIANSRAAKNATPDSAGVDLGLRHNRDGSLYDALDPRQNPAAASTQDNTATTGNAEPNEAGRAPVNATNGSDFPYGINGAR